MPAAPRCILAAIPACLLLTGLPAAAEPEPPVFDTNSEEYLYYWGTRLAEQVAAARIDDDESLAWIARGLVDQAAGRAPAFGEEYNSLLNNYLVLRVREAALKERELAASYLEARAAEAGARRLESGLVYQELAAGSGEPPGRAATVLVHYTGTLRDGTVFDSSITRGQPLSAALDRVIDCWTEGLGLVRPGGKARISCPPDLGYGDFGNERIPGGAALTFEVELLEILD